jgi:hypothetical protein
MPQSLAKQVIWRRRRHAQQLNAACAAADRETVMNDELPGPHKVEKSATDARQGMTTGRVRWILGISLALGVIALAVSYWIA